MGRMGMVHGMESDEMRLMLGERQCSHAAGMDFQMKLSLKSKKHKNHNTTICRNKKHIQTTFILQACKEQEKKTH